HHEQPVSRLPRSWWVRRQAMVGRRGLAVAAHVRRGVARVLGTARRHLVLARNVRVDSFAARLAGVRESGRGAGVRAVVRTASADGGGISTGDIWIAGRR